MTYVQSDYSKALVPWSENEDLDWGAYKWPQGVPSAKLATAVSSDGTKFVVRKELRALVQTLIEWSELSGYPVHTPNGGWSGGYANRAIAGTSTASAHSRARTIDVRAIDNPQSVTFRSTWPPEILRGWLECGFWWGGHYSPPTKYDTMHLTYCRPMTSLEADLQRATALLEQAKGSGSPEPAPTPTPPPKPEPMPYPLKGGQVFGTWNEKGWAKLTRSGDPRWDGSDIRDYVRMIQRIVGTPADGIFGVKTRAAVVKWQRSHKGLAVDGMVGARSWAVMFGGKR